jgi:transcriptional regulator with XRE-family HTH domain
VAKRSGPVVVRRRLGGELRHLRERRNLRLEHVARLMECSVSKISRLENGLTIPRTVEVRALLDIYEPGDNDREKLMRWTAQAKAQGWWHDSFSPRPAATDMYLSLEEEAHREQIYCAPIVPGLLQTADYARAMFKSLFREYGDAEIEDLVAVRVARQQVLSRSEDPLHLNVILDEGALRRIVGSVATMREELLHLLEMSQWPRISTHILPYTAGPTLASFGTFTIFSPAEAIDPVVVHVEGIRRDLYLEEPADVQYFQRLFADLEHAVLGPRETRGFIQSLIASQYSLED